MPVKTKYLFFTAVFLAGLLFARWHYDVQTRTYNLTEDDTGKTLGVSLGSLIKLTLPDHVDGGFRFDSIRYDHKILLLQLHRENSPAPGSPRGASGMGIWQFVAVKQGVTPISLTASRPWRRGATVSVFENKVMVK